MIKRFCLFSIFFLIVVNNTFALNEAKRNIAVLDFGSQGVFASDSVDNQAYALPKEVIVVVIKENSPENVAVGGQLVIDRKK